MMVIHIKNLKLNVIIGILEQERHLPQHIIVNAKIWYHYNQKNMYIDYIELVSLLHKRLENKRYGLLEDALNDLSQHIFLQFTQIYKIKLKLTKTEICKECLISVSQVYHTNKTIPL